MTDTAAAPTYISELLALMREWDWESNAKDPSTLTLGSHYKAAWICARKHAFSMLVHERVQGRECTDCSGPRCYQGISDLESQNPYLASEFHPTKNEHPVYWYATGSNKKVWWLCKLGHEWEAVVNSRHAKGYGCPFCSNQRLLVGFNDLQTRFPDLAIEFDSQRNGIASREVLAGGTTRYWWHCKRCGYDWRQHLNNRIANGSNCPACFGKKPIKGYSDLETRCPDLLSEFDYEKNSKTPDDIHYHSRTSYWWKCLAQGHEWKTDPNSRSRQGHGCPKCCLRSTSTIENLVREGLRAMPFFTEVSKDHTDSVEVTREAKGRYKKRQVDALCTFKDGRQLIVEYDGSRWHFGAAEKDRAKTKLLLEAGYAVIRIREQSKRFPLPLLELSDPNLHQLTYQYVSKHHKNLPELLNQLEGAIRELHPPIVTR